MKNITRRNFLLGSAASIALFSLSSCAPKKQEEVTKSVRVALAYESDNFSPLANTNSFSIVTNWYVYEGLYNLDRQENKIYNGLAALNPIKIDPTHYEIVLEDDAKFSNGALVKIEDIIRSFNAFKNNEIFCGILEPIIGFDKYSEKSVLVTTSYNCEKILKDILSCVYIYSVDEKGTGPWCYSSLENSKAMLVPNKYYNGKYNYKYESIYFFAETDDSKRLALLVNNQADIIENACPEHTKNIESVNAKIDYKPSSSALMVLFNINSPSFSDVAARQAFMYSIDAQNLVDNYLYGKASIADSVLPRYHEDYRKAKTTYNYNPVEAKKLLNKNLNIKVLISKGLPNGIENDINKYLSNVGFNPSIEVKDLCWDNSDVFLFPMDIAMYSNNANVILSNLYGDNVWTEKRSHFKETQRWKELQNYIKQNDLSKCYDLVSDEVPIYPLYFKDHSIAYCPARLNNFENVNVTGVIL